MFPASTLLLKKKKEKEASKSPYIVAVRANMEGQTHFLRLASLTGHSLTTGSSGGPRGADELPLSASFEPACISRAHPLCLAGGDRQAAERNLRPSRPLPLPGGKTGESLRVEIGRARVREGGGLTQQRGKCVVDCGNITDSYIINTHIHTH